MVRFGSVGMSDGDLLNTLMNTGVSLYASLPCILKLIDLCIEY